MFSLSHDDEQKLLNIAIESIEFGLKYGGYLRINEQQYSVALRNHCAAFTTLKCDNTLRGCAGTIEAKLPLISAVSHSAYTSAFHDSRFPPLQFSEFDQLDVSISILRQVEELSFTSEEDLVEHIRPGIDGLVFEYNGRKGTLLPSVWDAIPDRRQFLSVVKQKAGFTKDFWANDVRVSRYTTHIIKK